MNISFGSFQTHSRFNASESPTNSHKLLDRAARFQGEREMLESEMRVCSSKTAERRLESNQFNAQHFD